MPDDSPPLDQPADKADSLSWEGAPTADGPLVRRMREYATNDNAVRTLPAAAFDVIAGDGA